MKTPYLPTLPALARETVTMIAASLVAAYVISKVPAWRALVRANSLPQP